MTEKKLSYNSCVFLENKIYIQKLLLSVVMGSRRM